MSVLGKIKQGIKGLVERHGSEVGVCAKVAVAALMPGGWGIPEVVRALCDYAGEKGQAL